MNRVVAGSLAFVVSLATPLAARADARADARAAKFDVGRVKREDLAKTAGAPEE